MAQGGEYKVGLIGLGEISSYFITGVEQNPRTELVAVCRRRIQEGDLEKYKAYKFYQDWTQLVDDPIVNCVIIATPPSTHAEITERCLKLHKKVISEKPFSLKLGDATRCIALAKETNTHLNFAYHAAMNPLSIRAKAVVDEHLVRGEEPTHVKVLYRELVTNYHGGESWIFDPKISGGGCLIDSGVNALSVVEFVVGHVEPTHVELGFKPETCGAVEVSANVKFVGTKYPNMQGELIQDWMWPGEESREIVITFKSGSLISFCFAKGKLTATTPDGKVTSQELEKQATDHHLTPMTFEYINVVNYAVDGFDSKDVIDPLGAGPFQTIMNCYQWYNEHKA